MFHRFLLSLGLLALCCTSALADKNEDDLKALTGVWAPVAGEIGGNALPAEGLRKLKLTIKGEAYTVEVDATTDQGTVKLDAAKTPKTMDILGTEGPNKGKTILAIYEFVDKDNFKVCYALVGDRPTEFKTVEGDQRLVFTYQRQTP